MFNRALGIKYSAVCVHGSLRLGRISDEMLSFGECRVRWFEEVVGGEVVEGEDAGGYVVGGDSAVLVAILTVGVPFL